jgi:hypothetical protein
VMTRQIHFLIQILALVDDDVGTVQEEPGEQINRLLLCLE